MEQFDGDAEHIELGRVSNQAIPETSTWQTTSSLTGTLVSQSHGPNSKASIGKHYRDRSNIWCVFVKFLRFCRSATQHPFSRPCVDEKDSVKRLVVRSLKDFRSGYPNLATFTDSDESYMIYRRFGYLQSRLLLEKQDELRNLEEQLDSLDHSEKYSDPDNLFSREYQGEVRKRLLTSIEGKFCEYSHLLMAAGQLKIFNRPTNRERQSVVNYLQNEDPVFEKEREYIYCKEDLITLRHGREHAWLDRIIERILQLAHRWPLKQSVEWLFCEKEAKQKASNETQVYYSRERIEVCSSVTITIMIVLMLILPIYLLYHLVENNSGAMTPKANAIYMGILLVFTLVFAAIMSCFTKAKRHEILGAAAAYCAVLIVFLGNLGSATSS